MHGDHKAGRAVLQTAVCLDHSRIAHAPAGSDSLHSNAFRHLNMTVATGFTYLRTYIVEHFVSSVAYFKGYLTQFTCRDDIVITIAIHEAGHATISWFLEYANPLVKVTIVPRGQALGAAWYLPEERTITTREQMLDEICATLGGRAAEELFTGHISSGALNDLERVNKSAFGMVAYLGMSDELTNICYYNTQQDYSFNKPYSENTAELIDTEVKKLIEEQYHRAKTILEEHKDGHAQLAQLLIEREVIFAEDVEKIFGKRPWKSRSDELIEENDRLLKQREEEEALEAIKEAEKKVQAAGLTPGTATSEEQTEDNPTTGETAPETDNNNNTSEERE